MPKTARYLRVSLINECNLGCLYCRPRGVVRPKIDRIGAATFRHAIELFGNLGVRKIRFTGGEPTLYRRLPELIAFAKSRASDMHVAITTNGLLLDHLADKLAQAGLDSANISLDTIDRNNFTRITGADRLSRVMKGIEQALKHISTVKLNCVVMTGINDHEAEAMIRLADTLGVDIRFIEYMPTRHGTKARRMYVSGATLRSSLPFNLTAVPGDTSAAARYYVTDDLHIRVGFIEPVSHPFCGGCDRVRLGSDGRLYNCLFSSESIDLAVALERGEAYAATEVRRMVARSGPRGCRPSMAADECPSFINIGG